MSLRNYFCRTAFTIFLFVLSLFVLLSEISFAEEWFDLKDEHFIIYFQTPNDQESARTILRKAEEFYDKIADQIGYTRYTNFWTWDARAKIFVFQDQSAFQEKTGQPGWSKGYASRDSQLFKSRAIITYKQETGFLDGVLPHEIAHLVFRDMVGFETYIPVWFEEGLAQLQEAEKKNMVFPYMKAMSGRGLYIPVELLNVWDIRTEQDPKKVSLFYAQSLSIVDFLIKEYGSQAFRNLCYNLKEGKKMQEAIRSSYSSSVENLKQVEEKWLKYMKK